VEQRNALDLAHDGARRAQPVAHGLHGEGLVEVLQEAVSLELVEVASFVAPGFVELTALFHEGPHFLALLLAKLLPVGVEEPARLVLVRPPSQFIQFLLVSHLRFLAFSSL